MFKKCILHIGPNKTGTSSIQDSLARNREVLEAAGYYYPPCGERSYFIASSFCQDPKSIFGNEVHLNGDVDQIKRLDQEQLDHIKQFAARGAETTLLLSSEWVGGLDSEELTQLREFLNSICLTVEVLAYIRDPIKHKVSLLQQDVWVGGALLDPMSLKGGATQAIHKKMSKVFGKEAYTARKFSKSSLVEGCVVTDFLSACGVRKDTINALDIIRTNENRSYEALLIADAYNRHVPLKVDGAYSVQRDIVPIIARVVGSSYSIDQKMKDKLLPAFQEEYDYILDEFGYSFGEEDYPQEIRPKWNGDTLDMLVDAFHRVEVEANKLQSQLFEEKAKLALNESRLEDAENLLIQALQQDTSAFSPLDLLIRHLENTGRVDSAIEIAAEFYTINPSSTMHVFTYKNLLMKTGQGDLAKTISKAAKVEIKLKSLAK